ncbi:hypothetical protein GCM10020254_09700 [Streptomyces goshikiensis]
MTVGALPSTSVRGLLRLGELRTQFLQTAGHVHGPGGVAEVTLDLTGDVGEGEGGELHLALGVVPVDRLDEADGSDLDDVVHVDAPAERAGAEPARRELDEREIHLDQGVARVLVLARPLLQDAQPAEEEPRQLACVARGHLPGVYHLGEFRLLCTCGTP